MSAGCCQNVCWGVLVEDHSVQTGVLVGPAACCANTSSDIANLTAPALRQCRLTVRKKSSLHLQQHPALLAALNIPTPALPDTFKGEGEMPSVAQLCVVQLRNISSHLETRTSSPGSRYCSSCRPKCRHALQWHFNHSHHFPFRLKPISC